MIQPDEEPYIVVKASVSCLNVYSCFHVAVTDSQDNLIFCSNTYNNTVQFKVNYYDRYRIKVTSYEDVRPSSICQWAYLDPCSNANFCFVFNRIFCPSCCIDKKFKLTDSNYDGLPIQNAQIYLRSLFCMPSPYVINITDGSGSGAILNGNYDITAAVTGYNNASITPANQDVTAGVNTYGFTIASTGTLTLNVTENGLVGGTAVEGAVFYRCDSAGDTYGAPITSDVNGDAVFDNVPYAATGAPFIYYKQTASADDHEFSRALASTTMTTNTQTIQIMNAPAASRTITLTDLNYANLPIDAGTVTFTTHV